MWKACNASSATVKARRAPSPDSSEPDRSATSPRQRSDGHGKDGRQSDAAGRPDHNLAYRSVDLRLEKIFKFGHLQRASIAGEAFNIFNYTNDACYDGFEPQLPTVNPKFGQPSCVVDNSTRRFQVGLRYSF
jgi:hypothetical protein